MSAGPVLVAGGTGRLGSLVVAGLLARDVPMRVLTREPARAAHLPPAAEIVIGDVRDAGQAHEAVAGSRLVVSAVHGFAGPGKVSPDSVDRLGNANLIEAAAGSGAEMVLVSVVGAAADHPMELHRAKFAAEERLWASGVPATVIRATPFLELWADIVGGPMRKGGRALVFGRGDNAVNFVSVRDVAAVVERAVLDGDLRGETIEVGSAENVTFNQFARLVGDALGVDAGIRHVPRAALHTMATVAGLVSPVAARQGRAALIMDRAPMAFDRSQRAARLLDLVPTGLSAALGRWAAEGRGGDAGRPGARASASEA